MGPYALAFIVETRYHIPMTHYLQFVSSLTFGLLGLGLVMMILMDNVFIDIDPVKAAADFYRNWHRGRALRNERTEDLLMAIEHGRVRPLSTRMIDRRREELNQIDEVEHRLHQAPLPSADGPLKVLLAVDAANASSPTDGWGPN